MKKVRCIVAVLLFLVFAIFTTSAMAEIMAGAITLSPHVGGYIFDKGQDIKNGPVFGLGVEYDFTKHIGAEIVYDYVSSESKSPGADDVKANLLRLDGLYHFMPDKQFVPYVSAGVGAVNLDDDVTGDSTNALVNIGLGFKYFLTEALIFRTELRDIFTYNASNNNLAYTFGISYMFGGAKASAPVAVPIALEIVPPPPAPKAKPTPPPPPVKEVAPEPPPVKETKVVMLEDVHFDFDKATLTEEAKGILKKNIRTLNDNPGVKVRIEGNTCAHGAEDYNLRLSERRANAVKEYLATEGKITAHRMTTISYGETRLAMPENPVPANKNSAEAKANRRVHFEVVVQ